MHLYDEIYSSTPKNGFYDVCYGFNCKSGAKWSHMTGGELKPCVTIRGIINRGGEQGAQHSQALHATFAHIPGLRVVMPYSVSDARDLFISSVLSPDPVIFIDDRWLYDNKENVKPIKKINLNKQKPKLIKNGQDITIVSCGYSTHLSMIASEILEEKYNITCDIVDLRVISLS